MKNLLAGKVVLVSGGTQGLVPASPEPPPAKEPPWSLAGRNAGHGEQVAAELIAAAPRPATCRPTSADVAQAIAAVKTTSSKHGRID